MEFNMHITYDVGEPHRITAWGDPGETLHRLADRLAQLDNQGLVAIKSVVINGEN